jgi:hypothetical protein
METARCPTTDEWKKKMWYFHKKGTKAERRQIRDEPT